MTIHELADEKHDDWRDERDGNAIGLRLDLKGVALYLKNSLTWPRVVDLGTVTVREWDTFLVVEGAIQDGDRSLRVDLDGIAYRVHCPDEWMAK